MGLEGLILIFFFKKTLPKNSVLTSISSLNRFSNFDPGGNITVEWLFYCLDHSFEKANFWTQRENIIFYQYLE